MTFIDDYIYGRQFLLVNFYTGRPVTYSIEWWSCLTHSPIVIIDHYVSWSLWQTVTDLYRVLAYVLVSSKKQVARVWIGPGLPKSII